MEIRALVCGLLEDGGRALFLLRKDGQGTERLTLPNALVGEGDPVALLAEAFRKQTGIDGEIREVVIEPKWNAGSRKRRRLVPCLVFKVTAKNARCSPGLGFSGFKWIPLSEVRDVRKAKSIPLLDRRIEWLRQRKE